MNTDSCKLHDSSYIEYFFNNLLPPKTPASRILGLWYPDGPKCGSCGASITGRRSVASFWEGERTFCASCGTKFSPRVNTPLKDLHISFAQFEIFLVMIDAGSPYPQIAKLAGVHTDTIASWHSKIKFFQTQEQARTAAWIG